MAKVKVSISESDMKSMVNEIIRQSLPQILNELERFAKEELKVAYGDADYNKHRTQNLKDSYVYGIYYNNVLQRYGFLTDSPTAKEVIKETGTGRWVYGRDEAKDFILSNKPNSNAMFHIVFGARMYYGAYLENGTRRNKPYTVISSLYQDLNYGKYLENVKITTQVHTY